MTIDKQLQSHREKKPGDAVPSDEALVRVPPKGRHKARTSLKRHAVPFFKVMGYYAVGIFTFSVMAAANVPGGGNVSQFIWAAVQSTGLIALAVALAAGRWWV